MPINISSWQKNVNAFEAQKSGFDLALRPCILSICRNPSTTTYFYIIDGY